MQIAELDYSFPEGFPEVAKDLVQKLLVMEPDKRLGEVDTRNAHRALACSLHFQQHSAQCEVAIAVCG